MATRAFVRYGARAGAYARPAFTAQIRRNATQSAPKSSNRGTIIGLTLGAAGLAGGYYYYTQQSTNLKPMAFTPTFEDYKRVYKQIADKLQDEDDYDDGSYGPVLLRLAWHCSGTYDKATNTGGSNGATMRFAPEKDHGANSGLAAARDFMEPIKQKNPWITYSDLWTLGGVCAVQEMGGPAIKWRPGRTDKDTSYVSPDGRLPDASKAQDHLRAIFHRMGFDDREIVALSGAHALGRCHADRSGFSGPWTFSPTVVTNDYFTLLLNEKWNYKKWNGPKQFEDQTTKSLMMLPTDMALVKDKEFRKHVERYAKDNAVFFKEFSDVVHKLFELGCDFKDKECFTFLALNA